MTYAGAVTAKQRLLQCVEELTEYQAAEWLALFYEVRAGRPMPLTVDQMVMIRRGMADARAGRVVPQEEVWRTFGLERRS